MFRNFTLFYFEDCFDISCCVITNKSVSVWPLTYALFAGKLFVKVRLCRYLPVWVLLPAQRRHLPVSLRLGYVQNKVLRNVCSIAYIITTKKEHYIFMCNFRILIYFSYISSKHLNLLWCYLTTGSLVLVDIPLSITNKMQRYTIFFIAVNSLHVPGGFSAHHQELKNCTHTSSGLCQACFLLPLTWVSW